jgi:type VI secretion system secreted protein VgrG
MHRSESFFFAWEGASAPEGPWSHLLVLEARGAEELNAPYEYDIDLVQAEGAPPVSVEELLGANATLRIRTRSSPGARLVHGVVAEAEQLDVEGPGRFRVSLQPPIVRDRMRRRSLVYVDKTMRQILDRTLGGAPIGMGLTQTAGARLEVEDDAGYEHRPFAATYAWQCTERPRLDDESARPYVVQYEESFVDFMARLLEEEGIAYHFEHTETECVLVLSDTDAGRRDLRARLHLGPNVRDGDVRSMRLGGRLRPKGVALSDFDWRRPDLDIQALSPNAEDPFLTTEHPGRYGAPKELGEALAAIREAEHGAGSIRATFETSSRVLSAGTVFTLDHPHARFAGGYLVRRIEVTMRERASFSGAADAEPTYRARVEVIRCDPRSRFVPVRRTPRPRIWGSQTAVVTAEPGQAQEINVGGDADLGCVRVRFHWDREAVRHQREPTSCWIRTSQAFAGGRGHGAMFHPRVNDEVVVAFLEGDPDRPIVTGRVYNGRNLAPENATRRPTWSCMKSMSSPYDGNYNMLAFDDLQGAEKLVVHAARDYVTNVEHDSSRSVANFDEIFVKGDQKLTVLGNQTSAFGPQKVTVTGDQSTVVTGTQSNTAVVALEETVGGSATQKVGAARTATIGVIDTTNAPMIVRQASSISDQATTITLSGSVVMVRGATVSVTADNVQVSGGVVNVVGATINLNS